MGCVWFIAELVQTTSQQKELEKPNDEQSEPQVDAIHSE